VADNGFDFLRQQHRTIESMLSAVSSAPAAERGAKFDSLRELLAVHETAEEIIVRPLTRSALDDGDAVADARFSEENEAKQVLSDLEKLDPATDEFKVKFDAFAADVREHAKHEEETEFAPVEQSQDADALSKLATALKAAEKVAPTHPHPSASSTTANVVLGPFASMVDRIRDALKKAS
jgi:hemerythrin superfamily protein